MQNKIKGSKKLTLVRNKLFEEGFDNRADLRDAHESGFCGIISKDADRLRDLFIWCKDLRQAGIGSAGANYCDLQTAKFDIEVCKVFYGPRYKIIRSLAELRMNEPKKAAIKMLALTRTNFKQFCLRNGIDPSDIKRDTQHSRDIEEAYTHGFTPFQVTEQRLQNFRKAEQFWIPHIKRKKQQQSSVTATGWMAANPYLNELLYHIPYSEQPFLLFGAIFPFLEEILKEIITYFLLSILMFIFQDKVTPFAYVSMIAGLLFGYIEFVGKVQTLTFSYFMIVPWVLHFIIGLFPYVFRVLLHSTYNTSVLLYFNDYGGSCVLGSFELFFNSEGAVHIAELAQTVDTHTIIHFAPEISAFFSETFLKDLLMERKRATAVDHLKYAMFYCGHLSLLLLYFRFMRDNHAARWPLYQRFLNWLMAPIYLIVKSVEENRVPVTHLWSHVRAFDRIHVDASVQNVESGIAIARVSHPPLVEVPPSIPPPLVLPLSPMMDRLYTNEEIDEALRGFDINDFDFDLPLINLNSASSQYTMLTNKKADGADVALMLGIIAGKAMLLKEFYLPRLRECKSVFECINITFTLMLSQLRVSDVPTIKLLIESKLALVSNAMNEIVKMFTQRLSITKPKIDEFSKQVGIAAGDMIDSVYAFPQNVQTSSVDYVPSFADAKGNLSNWYEKHLNDIDGVSQSLAYTTGSDYAGLAKAFMDSKCANLFQAFAATSVATLLMAGIESTLPFGEMISFYLRSINTVVKAASETALMSDIMQCLCNEVLPALYYVDPSYLKPDSFTKKLGLIVQAVTIGEMRDITGMKKIIVDWGCEVHNLDNTAVTLKFLAVLVEMETLVCSNRNLNQMSTMRTVAQQLSTCILRIRSEVENGMERLQPYCVGMSGPPGCGKTESIYKVIAALSKPLALPLYSTGAVDGYLRAESYKNLNGGDKFFDNVSVDTMILVIDDIGIEPNSFATVNLHLIVMHICGTAVYTIPRSSIEGKSGQYFCNKLTILTSNFADYGVRGYLSEPKAFKRRITADVTFNIAEPTPEHIANNRKNVIYSVALYRGEDNYKHFIDITDFNDVLKILHMDCILFLHQRNDFRREIKDLSKICKNCKDYFCSCTSASTFNTSSRADILSFISQVEPVIVAPKPTIISVDSVHSKDALWINPMSYGQVIRITLLEESFSQLIAFCLSWFVHPYFIIGIMCFIRELIEVKLCKKKIYGGRILLFALLHYVHPPLAFLIHVCYNAIFYFDFTIDAIEMFLDDHLDAAMRLRIQDIMIEIFGLESVLVARDRYLKVTADVDTVMNSLKEHAFTKVVMLFGLGGVVGLTLYNFIKLFSTTSQYTALGTIPTAEDLAVKKELSGLVQGDFVPVQTGVANTWLKKTHEAVYEKSSGTYPNSVKNCHVTLTADYASARGFVADGRLFTASHYTVAPFAKNEVLSTKVHLVGGIVRDADFDSKSVMLTKLEHDIVTIPFSVDFKTPSINYCFKPRRGDKFLFNDCIGDVVCIFDRTTSVLNGITITEPAGAFKITNKSALGLSGSPVFLVHTQGVDIVPTIIGLASRLVVETQECVVSPLTMSTKLLPIPEVKYSTSDIVTYFNKEGCSVSPVTDPRSVLSHLESISAIGTYCGSIQRYINNQESEFRRSPLFYPSLDMFPNNKLLCIPTLHNHTVDGQFVSPLLACARQMSACGTVNNEGVFWDATHIVYDEIQKHCDFSQCKPLSISQTIAGTFVTQPLNRKSSAGFPFVATKKNDLVVGSYDEPTFTAEYGSRLIKLIHDMDKGIPPINLATASVKDEIIKESKAKVGGERIFFSGNVDFLMLCRMYLAPIMEVLTCMRSKLFGQVGMNAIGREFHDRLFSMVFEPIDITKDKGFIDSDYIKYDKLLAVLKYAVALLRWIVDTIPFFKANAVEYNRICLIISSLSEYVVILGKDIFLMRAKMPSGVYATAILNCICEAILEVVQFYYCIAITIKPQVEPRNFINPWKEYFPFFLCIALINYGDDNLKWVSRKCRRFYTHENIMRFAQAICMGITPAHKTDPTIEFKDITEIVFLKRTPIYNSVLNRYVGCLDFDSIGKMLAYTDSIEESWETCVLDQAQREISFHGKEKYDHFMKTFECNQKLTKYTWEDTLLRIESNPEYWNQDDSLVCGASAIEIGI